MVQNEFKFETHSKNKDVGKFICFLIFQERWITARQMKYQTGWTDRHCRKLAQHSGGRIISGQKGYKATIRATVEERTHAKAWLRSQAHKMDVRAMEIEIIDKK